MNLDLIKRHPFLLQVLLTFFILPENRIFPSYNVAFEKLPAKLISENYISPETGIKFMQAKSLIESNIKTQLEIKKLKSKIELQEITTAKIWENQKVQIFRAKLDYLWKDQIIILKKKTIVGTIESHQIKEIFIADLDKDNNYEIYANCSYGSGIISNEIKGFNLEKNEAYELSDRMQNDYQLYITNEKLMIQISARISEENGLSTINHKTLVLEDQNIKIIH